MDLEARMADDAPEGVSEAVRFRDDILRGARLGLIAFAAILIGVWAYRLLRVPSDVQGATQLEAPAAPEAQPAAQDPAPDAAPVAEATSESHGLVVPPPPPVGGKEPVSKVAHSKVSVPPPPPAPVVARARRVQAPSGREFETSEPGVLPASPAEESADASQSAPKGGVGYKSLLEADPNRAGLEPALAAQQEQPGEKPKGNRFLRAVGKIFRPGRKETVPLTLQQPKQ